MRIKLIDFGFENAPYRAHSNDAGADVYAMDDYTIKAHEVVKIPLGFGLELPDGFAAFIFPRGSMASKNIVSELPPVDSGYRGEIHAIVTNTGDTDKVIAKGERVAQIVVIPVVIAEFTTEETKQRGSGAFGSTGK